MTPAEIVAAMCAAIGTVVLAFGCVVTAVTVASFTVARVCRWLPARPWADRRYGAPHNLIGHPLLVVCPPLGRWVHRRTSPMVPTIAARLEARRRARRAAAAPGTPALRSVAEQHGLRGHRRDRIVFGPDDWYHDEPSAASLVVEFGPGDTDADGGRP